MSPLALRLPHAAGRLLPAVRHGLVILLLGTAALAWYSLGRSPEFRGDDDYLYPASFSVITDALQSLDFSSAHAFGTSLFHLAGYTACSPRHAPLPALINAFFYALCDRLHIPFSLALLQFPIAAISAASVMLLFGLLRRSMPASPGWCVAGALLLMLSPIFTAISRGTATYFLPFAVFSTLLALLALDTANRDDGPRWWVGLALAQVVLSDVIWFVTLPLLLFAFVAASPDRKKSRGRLLSVRVAGPVTVAVLLILMGTWLAYSKGLTTPLLTLLGEHGAKISHGAPVIQSPAFLAECLVLLMGVMLPLLVPSGLLIWWRAGRPLRPGWLTVFGLVGILAYGTLFYGISPERNFVKHCYQIYLLLPVILLVMGLADLLQRRFRHGITVAACLLATLLLFESLACVTYIWKVPASPWSNVFARHSSGTVVRNEGTKAAGYVVRRWLECLWRRNPHQPVLLTSSRYDMSFAVFSGLNAGEAGWVFEPEFGPHRPIGARTNPALRPDPGSAAQGQPDRIYLVDLGGQSEPLHYTIRPASPRDATVLIVVRPPDGSLTPPFPPGELSMENLEARFDREYNRYTDFFPRRLAQGPTSP